MRYVVGFMRDLKFGAVLLLRKNKPAWQAGLLNGVGGAIEDGETAFMAMCREWREEAGFEFRDWRPLARLEAVGATIDFFAASVGYIPIFLEANDIGESFQLVGLDTIVSRTDMIPNLRWLLLAAFCDPAMPYMTVRDDVDTKRVAHG